MIQSYDTIHAEKFYYMNKVVFPDGQPHFSLERPYEFPFSEEVNILARLSSGNDLLELNYFMDFLGWNGVEKVNLRISYLMGARMDRRIDSSELPLPLIREMLNPLGKVELCSISIFDPHSDVATAIFDANVITNEWLVEKHIQYFGLNRDDVILVSPDAGAAKKTINVGKALNLPVIFASKKRNVTTGELSGFEIGAGICGGINKVAIIVDDICDGGGTFVGLADVIENQSNGWIKTHLVVSHGIFSKGYILSGVDHITTTDSYKDFDWIDNHYMNVVKLEEDHFLV